MMKYIVAVSLLLICQTTSLSAQSMPSLTPNPIAMFSAAPASTLRPVSSQLSSDQLAILSAALVIPSNSSPDTNLKSFEELSKDTQAIGDFNWRMIPERASIGWDALSSLLSGKTKSQPPVLRRPKTSDMLPWNPVDTLMSKLPSWLTGAMGNNINHEIVFDQLMVLWSQRLRALESATSGFLETNEPGLDQKDKVAYLSELIHQITGPEQTVESDLNAILVDRPSHQVERVEDRLKYW